MMKIVGIVCEYNPFHNGHEYQIKKSLEVTGADRVVCFMSGHFLQRGIPALADKYTRAGIALSSGADAVFEIPFVYATSSARDYAYAAVSMMNALEAVDYISFGAETDNLPLLNELAAIICDEPASMSDELKKLMSSGLSYAVARARALTAYISESKRDLCPVPEELDTILKSPNNILALEYLCALKSTGSRISPVLIQREISEYNSTSAEHDICSATAIRYLLEAGTLPDIRRHVPQSCYDTLQDNYMKTFPVFTDDISYMLGCARLLGDDNSDIADLEKDLANRLSKININLTFEQTTQLLKCRNYTMTHVQRGLLHKIVGLTADDYRLFKKEGPILYAKLLGLRKSSGDVISLFKQKSSIPVITRSVEINHTGSDICRKMFEYDVKASRIYSNIVYRKFGNDIKDDYARSVITL